MQQGDQLGSTAPGLLWPSNPSCSIWADCIPPCPLPPMLIMSASGVASASLRPYPVQHPNDAHWRACKQQLSNLAPDDLVLLVRKEIRQTLFPGAQAPIINIPMMNGKASPLARDCAPIGTPAYCAAHICKSIPSIQHDLHVPALIPLHV